MKTRFFAAVCAGVLFLAVSVSASAALYSRLNGQAVYDDDTSGILSIGANITWLANTNLAASNTFGVSGINADGSMSWYTAQAWIAAMNAANYLGFNDWRLPTSDGFCTGFNCTDNPMGHLFYNELGGTAGNSINGSTDPDLALFTPFYNFPYLTDYQGNLGVWTFDFGLGRQLDTSSGSGFVLPMRFGDVAATPIPAATWLFGSGLLALVGVARRKAA